MLAGAGWAAAAGALALFGARCGPASAQAPAQRDWRYCVKCAALYFDGYPAKGACPAGGGHQAAGYNFSLPHDVAETAGAQKNWRFCRKCSGLYFDGYPAKGRCAAGGGHEAAGFNFVLPHDTAETPVAQKNWRFCGKCQALFFDGYPGKCVCPAGGGHQAAGYMFVLAHDSDYPGKVDHLAQLGGGMPGVLQNMWNAAGRAIVAERVEQAVNGRRFASGVNGYNAQASIGDASANVRRVAPNRYAVELQAPGNNVEFHATTPTVFGSAMDPAFRVGFSILLAFEMTVRNARPPIDIAVVDARMGNATVHGSNAVGTLVETVADFFTGGEFSRNITERINQDASLKSRVAQAIATALDRVW